MTETGLAEAAGALGLIAARSRRIQDIWLGVCRPDSTTSAEFAAGPVPPAISPPSRGVATHAVPPPTTRIMAQRAEGAAEPACLLFTIRALTKASASQPEEVTPTAISPKVPVRITREAVFTDPRGDMTIPPRQVHQSAMHGTAPRRPGRWRHPMFGF